MSDTMGVRSWKPGKMRRRDRVLAVAFATILNATSSRTQQRVWATDFGPSLGVSEFDQAPCLPVPIPLLHFHSCGLRSVHPRPNR